ncbi:MAG: hypothetical protein IPP71_12325 [Bacteroidetes bacterium]|nr:hypothetical protein [Bacteroidota bacterium]
MKQVPLYWGTQPGTSGPVYFGAIIMFLLYWECLLLKQNIEFGWLPVLSSLWCYPGVGTLLSNGFGFSVFARF